MTIIFDKNVLMVLNYILFDLRENIIFGIPAHLIHDHLNVYFQNQWIGTYGPIEWPP